MKQHQSDTRRGDRSPTNSRADGAVEPQELSDTVSNILEEARMILPGTETLFGFQLIVVFNSRFTEALDATEQRLHLAATMLVVVAIAMLLTPAAYHRQVEPESISERFVQLASRLLSWSLLPLMIAISVDFYLVATLVTGDWSVSVALAAVVLLVFAGLWFVFPRLAAPRQAQGGS